MLGFVIIVSAWQLASTLGLMQPGLLPTPGEVGRVLLEGLWSGNLLNDLLISSRRVVIGVTIGMAAAIPIGFALGWFPRARVTFNPLVNFFRALPPIALVPLVVIYFGIGEVAREVILVYAAFFATIIVVYEGIGGIEEKYVRAGRTLGAGRMELFTRVVLPLSTPHIFTAARISLGIGWSSLVAAELVAAQDGLGAAIQNASNYLDVPTMYAGIILIGAAALAMDLAIRVTASRVLRWQDRGER
ncbi:ABC transporter permease [Promicromonospora xylanilytica]